MSTSDLTIIGQSFQEKWHQPHSKPFSHSFTLFMMVSEHLDYRYGGLNLLMSPCQN